MTSLDVHSLAPNRNLRGCEPNRPCVLNAVSCSKISAKPLPGEAPQQSLVIFANPNLEAGRHGGQSRRGALLHSQLSAQCELGKGQGVSHKTHSSTREALSLSTSVIRDLSPLPANDDSATPKNP